jgi:hypothetical protein
MNAESQRPNQEPATKDYDRCAAFLTDHAGCAVCVWLCISQAATDDPHISYHHRGHAEYDQYFNFLFSLFD